MNTNSEIPQTRQTQTMEAIGWIEDNTNALKALEFSHIPQSGFSVGEPITWTGQEVKLFKLYNEMLDKLADIGKQTNVR